MATEKYLSITKGSDLTVRLTVLDASGTPVDLTAHELRFTVRNKPCEEGTLLIAKDSTDPAKIEILPQVGADVGVALLKLQGADTASLQAGRYYFDVWLILPLNSGRTVIIKPSPFEVTHRITVAA